MRCLATRVPAPVQRDIRSNPEKPGGELGVRLVTVTKAVHPQEYVLRQLLRDGSIANQPVQMVDYRSPVPRQQRLKAGLMASTDLDHQSCIGIEGPLRRHELKTRGPKDSFRPACNFS